MTITPSKIGDLADIEILYNLAIEYQRSRGANPWQGMNKPLIEKEIAEQLHWKINEKGAIACFFSVAFTDRLVWDDRDSEPSIYLHRIVTNPLFRGNGYVRHIVAWAEGYGRSMGKDYIRLDTGRDNRRLNAYYRECGFEYCGVKQFDDDSGPAVPGHYLGSGLSLFERKITRLSST
jgi:ribosomal protein S18 acetylase RimI-like enzyme